MRRSDAAPIYINPERRTSVALERLPLSERSLDEGWLQDLLFTNPAILPIDEVEPAFAPLVPIGREVSTDVGRIDALYVAPSGLLTLVEAKLWTNPQARREVVAQIIDYAKELTLWTYDDLDQYARRSHGRPLWELMRASHHDDTQLSEAAFVDEVTKNLRRGRFLLLIVGDGIREDAERMSSFLQQTPHLHFSLALIELKIYATPDGEALLVVPSVVARTQEVVRAVVRIESGSGVTASVSLPMSEPGVGAKSKSSLSEADFIANFTDDPRNSGETLFCVEAILATCRDEPHLDVRWNARTFAVLAKVGSPTSGLPSMLSIGETGVVKFHDGSFEKNIRKRGVSPHSAAIITENYLAGLVDIFGTDVTHAVLYFGEGPHLNLLQGDPSPIQRLIRNTVEAIVEELEPARG
jgi:hypothetical protein